MRGKAPYRPDIDGLRGIAILAVIANHCDEHFLPSGFLGVDIFFAISGYVITGSILAHTATSTRGFFADFYRRRVQRLVPALVVCVGITALLTCLFNPDPQESLLTGAYALAGASNFFLYFQATDYFGGDALLNSFTQTWSLGVEEQFYLVFPAATWLVGLTSGERRSDGVGRRRLRQLLWVVVAASLLLFLVFHRTDPAAAYYLPFPRLWEMAAGCLLYLMLQRRPGHGQALRRPLAGGLMLAAIVLLFLAPLAWIGVTTPLAILATCGLIAGTRAGGITYRLLTLPWLLRIGLVSYSLYLWHWSVLTLSRWTIGISAWTLPLQLIAMYLLAEISFRLLETPLRRNTWTPRKWQTVLVGLGANGLIATNLVILSLDGIGSGLYAGERTATLSQQRDRQRIPGTPLNNDDCLVDRDDRLDGRRFRRHLETCSVDAGGDGNPRSPRIFVAGDSHAASLLPLAARLHGEGHPVTQLTKSGCPFPILGYGHEEPSCEEFAERTLRHILDSARPGDAVMIAGYHLSYLKSGVRDSRDTLRDGQGSTLTGTDEKIRAYTRAVSRFSERARERGLKVIVIGAGPRLFEREQCLPEWFRPAANLDECREALGKEIKRAAQLNRRLRQRMPADVSFIDPVDILCRGECSLADMRRFLFDNDHLSDQAVLRFERAVEEVLR